MYNEAVRRSGGVLYIPYKTYNRAETIIIKAVQKMTKLDATTIGMTIEEIKDIKVWLTETRVTQCSDSLKKWLLIGNICSRIKSAKIEGKFQDNVNEILGTVLTNDERQYSMKLHDLEKDIIKWYKKANCMKYNPRTIYTAYQTFLAPPKTEETKKTEKAEKAEKELRKERSGADAIKALVEYRKIRDKAGVDGNLVLGDLETLKSELENELKLINEAIEIEAPVKEAKKETTTKKAA